MPIVNEYLGDSPDARQRVVSPSWLARFWNVSPNTVYRDIRKGALRAFKVRGQYRVLIADAKKYGRPVE